MIPLYSLLELAEVRPRETNHPSFRRCFVVRSTQCSGNSTNIRVTMHESSRLIMKTKLFLPWTGVHTASVTRLCRLR